jgi:hypothetical protein
MHKILVYLHIIHLLKSSTCFEHYPAVDTVVCAPVDGWKYHPKHAEQFPDIYKMCNVASCWIYIGVLLGAHPILRISRIRVKKWQCCLKGGRRGQWKLTWWVYFSLPTLGAALSISWFVSYLNFLEGILFFHLHVAYDPLISPSIKRSKYNFECL